MRTLSLLVTVSFLVAHSASAFSAGGTTTLRVRSFTATAPRDLLLTGPATFATSSTSTTALFVDKSRSGSKRDRLDKLAELEESRIDTDKGFVLKAAGGFVGLIVILLVAAFAISGPPI